MDRRSWVLIALASLILVGVLSLWVLRALAPNPPGGAGASPGAGAAAAEPDPGAPAGSAAALGAPSSPLSWAVPVSSTTRDRALRDEFRKRIQQALANAAASGAARSEAPPAGAPAPSASAESPKLDADYIRQRVREDFVPLAKQCYEAALERAPDAGGKLVLQFTIVGDARVGGLVDSVELGRGTTLEDPKLVECMRESMMSMAFKPPPSGGMVTVVYPFVLSPEPSDAGR